MRLIHADAVVTGDSEIVSDGAILLGDGLRILDVGRASDLLPRHAGVTVEHIRGVVLPGLVNAHTHMELSALRGHVPSGGGFLKWVGGLMKARPVVRPEDDAQAIDGGVAELRAFCTSLVGDVTNSLAAVRSIAASGLEGAVFHEVYGITKDRFDLSFTAAEASHREREATFPKGLTYSRTPHTLYTTHKSGVERLVRDAGTQGTLSVHLSEHLPERRYLESGEGSVADWYEDQFGLKRSEFDIPRTSPTEYARSLGLLSPRTLLVHMTDATRAEFRLVAEHRGRVVLCPLSNAYIEEKLPPLPDVLDAGLEPSLGTDSLASNTSLDVLLEAKILAERFPDVPKVRLLRMATWNGAVALGREDAGRIAKGASPELWAIRGDVGADAASFVLAHHAAPREWIAARRGGK